MFRAALGPLGSPRDFLALVARELLHQIGRHHEGTSKLALI
jgi:hypothetical protein